LNKRKVEFKEGGGGVLAAGREMVGASTREVLTDEEKNQPRDEKRGFAK